MLKKIFLISILFIFNISFVLAAETSISTGAQLPNPLGDIDTPQELIGKIINSALGLVGSIALLMFIYGGFLWITSAGNPQNVQKGQDTLKWAVIGLVVVFTAYAIVKFVITELGVS